MKETAYSAIEKVISLVAALYIALIPCMLINT